MATSPFGNYQSQFEAVPSIVGQAGTGTYGSYHMNTGDFIYSLLPYMWSKFVPALRQRGLPFRHLLDVSNEVATTGASVKVTVAQNLSANSLSDGSTRVLDDTPPNVAEVVLADDITVSFGMTDVVRSFINKQPTVPAVMAGAAAGLLNAIEEQLIADLAANVPAANVVGAYNTALTAATISGGQSILAQNFYPQEDWYGLVYPSTNAWDSLIAIETITWIQTREAPATGTEASMVITPGGAYGQNIRYLGGIFSQSALVPAVNVSGVLNVSNLLWSNSALAVAVRPPEPPVPGTGAMGQNFTDVPSGISLQMLQTYNFQTLAPEMTLRTLIGDAPAQPIWSVIMKS